MPFPRPLFLTNLFTSLKILLAACSCIMVVQSEGQGKEGNDEIFPLEPMSDKPVLLIFAGSDWCIPCIKFHKEVLSDSSFRTFAQERLTVLIAEFPQKKKLSPEIIQRNGQLADRYNPSGSFPGILLLRPDGAVITHLDYHNQSVSEFIAQLKQYLTEDSGMKEFKTRTTLMGCIFEFTIVDSSDSDRGWKLIESGIREVQRIERLISEWSDTTQIGRLNSNAGLKAVQVDEEVYRLIDRCIKISGLTQGAFDITFGGAGKLWRFDPGKSQIPDPDAVQKGLELTGYEKIQLLDSFRVYLEEPGMMVGFGAVGKGYAAENVKKMLISQGISSGVINASGDLTAWGRRPDGDPWKIGIADPTDPSRVLLWLPVDNAAVATSGNYEKYIEIDGQRYGHIIDPRTGYPAKGIKSVTIISPSAELSDALATAVFVMGVNTGINLISQLPGIHCLIIDESNKIHFSEGMEILLED